MAAGNNDTVFVPGSIVNLTHKGHYVHWGVIQMSVANVVVIALMVLVFILAVAIPFPRDKDQ
ncbi:MAG: hypothetical protein ACR2NJ_06745 [Acidimicrobiales bacterium]